MNETVRELLQKLVDWTKLKFRLHTLKLNEPLYFKEREIWWVSLGINIGYEQNGKNERFERPVLILKKFNEHLLWTLPITSKDKTDKEYYQRTEYKNATYFVILSQLRAISSKRLLRKIRTLPEGEFKKIKEKVKGFL